MVLFVLILVQSLFITERVNHSYVFFLLWAYHYLHRRVSQHLNSLSILICRCLSQLGLVRIACFRHRQIPSLRSEPPYTPVKAKPYHQETEARPTSWHSLFILAVPLFFLSQTSESSLILLFFPDPELELFSEPDFQVCSSPGHSYGKWVHRFQSWLYFSLTGDLYCAQGYLPATV